MHTELHTFDGFLSLSLLLKRRMRCARSPGVGWASSSSLSSTVVVEALLG